MMGYADVQELHKSRKCNVVNTWNSISFELNGIVTHF